MEFGVGDSEVILFSSGIDSFIAWHYLGKPKCLHFVGHSRYSWKEKIAVEQFAERHPESKIIIVGDYWLSQFEAEDANIPGRNLHFAAVAAHYGDKVYLVCQRGEMVIPDRSPKFFTEVSELLTFLHGRPKLISPVFQDMTKADMVKWALENRVPREDLLSTYSCFSGLAGRCGGCPACARTAWALDYNNILPNNFFLQDIWKWEGWQQYISKIKAGKYESVRANQTELVLRKRGIWK